ncbi:MAG: YhcH/YjgK/YiaL family protein [Opitutaceae bacterium]|jgi:YhcH/YjgK/YiaL family protein|nr:YhcH/YjgK/YiaL family protein [Opitutaceae bacterium]
MALLGSLSTVRAQLAASPAFDLAFDYVARALTAGSPEATRIAAVPLGETVKVELGGGVFALEQAYLSKPPETGKWEAHERHIDVQVIVAGRELMEFTDVVALTLTEDYRAERDLMFYARFGGGSVFKAGPGAVAVFFPVDAHRPSLADGASAPVWKTVVKVPVGGAAVR